MKKTLTALMLIVAALCTGCHDQTDTDALRQLAEDSLQLGHAEYAEDLISRQMAAAKDSDTYYLWLSTRNKGYYAAMNVDSLTATSHRIRQYIDRHRSRNSRALQQLDAEWYAQRGAYYSAILGRPDSAISCCDSALRILQGLPERQSLRVVVMTNRAYFYRLLGRLDLSADGYLQAMAAADSIEGDNTNLRIAIALGISTAYTFMDDFATSTAWWERTAQLLPQMEKPDRFIYYNDRGNNYYLQKKYAEARPYFEQAAQLVKDDPRKEWDYYTALANLGEIGLCLGHADTARPLIEQADSFFHKVNFGILIYYVETSKIKLAMLEGRTADALSMARRSPTPDGMIPAAVVMRLETVEQLMAATGNYREAYDAHRQLHAVTDSIQADKARMQMNALLLQYEHDKRLLEQQRQIETGRLTARLAWALLAAALLAIALLVIVFRQRRRRQQMRELALRSKMVEMRMENTRQRITPHFIYNALSHEMLAQQHGRQVDFSALTQLLRRGLAMADVLQTTLKDELEFVDYYVTIEGQQLGPSFSYEKHVADGIDTATVMLPAMTVQIFVENAIKHGLRPLRNDDGRPLRLTVSVTRDNDGTLIEVTDNGVGLPADRRQQEHTGLRTVRQTIQLLNEQNTPPITFGTDNATEGSGCRSWLRLPDGYSYTLH